MSEVRANTISAANGTDPVTLTKQSASKSWINMFGDDASVRSSFNVSSTSDDATGQKSVTVTSSFSNANFATSVSVGETITSPGNRAGSSSPNSSSNFKFYCSSSNTGAYKDEDYMTASSFGDLA